MTGHLFVVDLQSKMLGDFEAVCFNIDNQQILPSSEALGTVGYTKIRVLRNCLIISRLGNLSPIMPSHVANHAYE